MSHMTLLQAIQCLQSPTRSGERDISIAAGVLLAELKRCVASLCRRGELAACDVEDLAHLIFERLWRALPSKSGLATATDAHAYLYGAARREARRLRQHFKRSPLIGDMTYLLANYGSADHGDEAGLYEELMALVRFTAARHAARQRAWLIESADEMICCLIGDGISRAKLSKMRGISIENLYQRHRRTRGALQKALDPFCQARGLPEEVRRLLATCLDGLKRV